MLSVSKGAHALLLTRARSSVLIQSSSGASALRAPHPSPFWKTRVLFGCDKSFAQRMAPKAGYHTHGPPQAHDRHIAALCTVTAFRAPSLACHRHKRAMYVGFSLEATTETLWHHLQRSCPQTA